MSVLDSKNDIGLEETIPEALKYKGALKSSVVISKSSIKLFPVGNQEVNSRRNRQILFRIASSEYLVPNEACLNFKLTVPDKGIYGQELVALSLLESISVSVGGVEVEHIVDLAQLTKLLIHHSVPYNTYEKTYKSMLGAWKHIPRENGYIKTSYSANGNFYTHFQDCAVDGISAGAGDGEQQVPIEGRVYSEDSFPLSEFDNELTGGGRHYSIPLHLISGLFRVRNLLPTWSLGSIDIKLDFSKFEKACLIAQSLDRQATGTMNVERDGNLIRRVAEADKYYDITDIHITASFVQCDSGYNTLLASLISTSSITMPFETYSTVQRNFTNSGTNQILISRGVSYLKASHIIMRPAAITENPYYDNDGGRFADWFKSVQLEIGSKLYHPHKIDSTQAMLRERDLAFDQYGHRNSGGVINWDKWSCKRNKFNNAGATPHLTVNTNRTNEVLQPNLEIKQDFIMSMNYEKLQGQAELSGVNFLPAPAYTQVCC